MNVNHLKAFGCVILFILILAMVLTMAECAASLIFMRDEVIFSASVVISLISSPMLLYGMAGSAFFFIFGRLPKHNKIIVKYLSMLMFLSFLVSFPISFYVDYTLKNDGYLVCDRNSRMTLTTYVRDLSLC